MTHFIPNIRPLHRKILLNSLFLGSLIYCWARIHEIPWETVWNNKELDKIIHVTVGACVIYVIQALVRRWIVSIAVLAGWMVYLCGPWPLAGTLLFLTSSLCLGRRLLRGYTSPSADWNLHLPFGAGLVIKSILLFVLSVTAGFFWQTLALLYAALFVVERSYISDLIKQTVAAAIPRRDSARHPFAFLLILSLAMIIAVTSLPEVGSDALTFHLAMPAFIHAHGFWHYDPVRLASSLMPLTGDLFFAESFLFAGEHGARFVTPLFVLLSAHLIASQVKFGPDKIVTASLYLTYPILFLESSSLFIDVIFSYIVVLSLLAFSKATEDKTPGVSDRLYGVALLLSGVACSTKLPGVIFAFTLFATYLVRTRDLKGTCKWGLLFSVVALPIYVLAYFKSGNPLFPFFNHIFKSPYFAADAPFKNDLFKSNFDFLTFFKLTFESGRYIEARNGANGLTYPLIMLPLIGSLLFVRALRLPFLIISIYFGITWWQQANLRYLLPFFTFASMGVTTVLEQITDDRIYRRVLLTVLFLAGAGSVYLGGTATWTCRDLYLTRNYPVTDYFKRYAPERVMQRELSRNAPTEGILMTDNSYSADYTGPLEVNTWLGPKIVDAIRSSGTAKELAQVVRRFNLRYVMFRTPIKEYHPKVLKEFLATCQVVLEAGSGRTCEVPSTP